MKLYKIYQDAPPIGKIIILLMVCVLAYVMYKVVTKLTAPKPANESILDASQTEIKTLQQSGENPSYSESQFLTFADKLEQAMSGQGTDEEQIKDVFHYMQNKTDVLKLIKAFGIKDYTDDKLLMWNVKPFNLNQWLAAELDSEELNEYVNDQLKAKQINYTF